MDMISQDGKRMIGNNAVTAIGTTSLIHQIAIHRIIPINLSPLNPISLGGSKKKLKKNKAGPKKVNIYDEYFLIFLNLPI